MALQILTKIIYRNFAALGCREHLATLKGYLHICATRKADSNKVKNKKIARYSNT